MEVPEQIIIENGVQRPTNIFVQHNVGSKFLLLNRPSALNALNLNMIRDLYNAYKASEQDESCQLFVLYGAGPKAFCAGGECRRRDTSTKPTEHLAGSILRACKRCCRRAPALPASPAAPRPSPAPRPPGAPT